MEAPLLGAPPARTETVIIGPERWFRWTAVENVETGRDARRLDIAGSHLLHPGVLLAEVRLRYVRQDVVGGRSTLVLGAIPHDAPVRPGSRLRGAGVGADDFEWHVDEERGILLRTDARLGGERFLRYELDGCVFDNELPEGIFDPPAGAALAERPPSIHREGIDEMRGRLEFGLFQPGDRAWRLIRQVTFDPRSASGRKVVRVLYRDTADRTLAAWHEACPEDGVAASEEWTPVEGDARRVWVRGIQSGDGTSWQVRFCESGTQVTLAEPLLSREELIALAGSMERVES